MKIILISSLIALYTSTIVVDAHTEPLGIGDIQLGVSSDEIIKAPKTQCRLLGMIHKYNVCSQIRMIHDIPVSSNYYFDNDFLEMIHITFDQKYFKNILSIINLKYGNASDDNTVDNSVRWVLPEGEIILSIMNTQPYMGEVKIFDKTGIDKRKAWILNHSVKEVNILN